MALNGKKPNGEVVTINLSRWQVIVGIVLASLLIVNALFTMVENIQGEEVHYIENGATLDSAIQRSATIVSQNFSHDLVALKEFHDKDINELKEDQKKLEEGVSRLDTKLDKILDILLRR